MPDSISFVRAKVRTVRGTVAVEWQKEGRSLRLKVTIPANSSATVHVPVAPGQRVRTDSATRLVRTGLGAATYEVGPGLHEFSATGGG